MAIAVGIGGHIAVQRLAVLNHPIPPAMMITLFLTSIIAVGAAAIAGEDVVEIEDSDVFVRIPHQPVVDQPVVENASIGGMAIIRLVCGQWWGGENDKEFILSGGEIDQDVAIVPLALATVMCSDQAS